MRRSQRWPRLPREVCSARGHTASQWLDLAEGRLAARSPEPQWRRHDFLPLAPPPHGAGPVETTVRPFLAEAEKVALPPSSAALRPATPQASGCVVDQARDEFRNLLRPRLRHNPIVPASLRRSRFAKAVHLALSIMQAA
jgi:hypothetical protein